MPLTVFDNAYFLASLGWAIANSFWQAGFLWLIYKFITGIKDKPSAIFKYNLSILLLFSSFAWFTITLIQNYLLLKNSAHTVINLFSSGSVFFAQKINLVLPYLSVVYILLLLVNTSKFVTLYFNLRYIKSGKLLKAPVEIRLFVDQTARHLGIKKSILIWLSEKVEVPSVIGFTKPIILLPVAVINQLSISQAETILLHELAHIKRNDFFINLIQSIIELILFFNPFSKLLSKAARIERENCCDDWVLNYQYNKHEYANALLLLEQYRFNHQKLLMAATNNKKALLNRVKRLFLATPQTSFNFLQKIQLTGFTMVILAGMFTIMPVITSRNHFQQTTAETTSRDNSNIYIPAATATSKEIPAISMISNSNETTTNAQATKLKIKVSDLHVKKSRKQQVENNTAEGYSVAFINEDLLKKDQESQTRVSAIADKDVTARIELFVKVEEEQSGKKQKNTYYFKLDNNLGKPEIKPLLIFNKYPDIPKPILNSIKDSTRSKIKVNKRITS